MFRSVLTCPAYHHIGDSVPEAAAQLGVWTTTQDFAAHLDYFESAFDIVDLDTLLHRPWPRRPLLLAFDDSYRSLATTVAPLLARRGLPGIVFLNPDMIERPVMMFDHVLSLLAERYGRERVLADIGADAIASGSIPAWLNGPATDLAPAARTDLQRRLLRSFDLDEAALHAETALYLRPQDIPLLVASGLEIGNHSASHARCRTLDQIELEVEIAGSKTRLEALSGRPVRSFSVPYGSHRDATPTVLSTLRASGHEVVFLADGRLTKKGPPGLQVWDRVPIDGVSAGAVRSHLGLRPRLRGVKDVVRGWRRAMPASVHHTAIEHTSAARHSVVMPTPLSA